MITAAAAAVSIIPAQADSAAETASEYYEVVDGKGKTTYNNINGVFSYINGTGSVSPITIIIFNDIPDFPGFAVVGGKTVTLTSSSDGPFTLFKTSAGRHITVYGNLTLENIILDGSDVGGGINIDYSTFPSSYGRLTMNDGAVIQNCTVTSSGGGGISLNTNCTLTMNDGAVIKDCSAASGGGIFSSGIFTMSGGLISGNKASVFGGGVYIGGSNFTMSGGLISGNTAELGGGVHIDMGVFTMSGGKISDNTATDFGGGVCNWGGSTFTISGGEISGNTANLGGGVYDGSPGTSNMTSGEISGNTANLGGGIFVRERFSITGGTISGNTAKGADASGSGGGIYTPYYYTLTVGSGVVFSDNTAPTLRMQNISDPSDDLTNYLNMISTGVVLNAPVDLNLNAPAYNNYDINYPSQYIVFIDIEPIGNGTVTVSDSVSGTVYEVITESGRTFVFVPIIIKSITLLATPGSEYEFVRFVIGGSEVGVNPTVSDVSWKMTVLAEFKQKEYIITYDVNGGDSNGPAEESAVNGTHLLSGIVPTYDKLGESRIMFIGWSLTKDGIISKDGEPPAMVTSVTVSGVGVNVYAVWANDTNANGIPDYEEGQYYIVYDANGGIGAPEADTDLLPGIHDLSTEEPTHADMNGHDVLFLGWSLTKADVLKLGGEVPVLITKATIISDNVTVYAVWGTDGIDAGGSGGSGSDTGSGGNGTSTGGSGGSGSDTGSGGNGTSTGGSGEAVEAGPTTHANGEWSVLSLIFAIAAIFTGMIAVIAGRDRFGTDSGERMSIIRIDLRALALIIGIVSAIMFFLTENWSLTPTAMGTWTPLMFVLLLATLILAMISFRFDKADS